MDIATGFIRGFFGIFILILISYLLSSNRKAISWRLVGVGLGLQLLLALGVLSGDKIGFNVGQWRFDLSFIRIGFDFAGRLFTNVLEFTREGSEFLLGGLMDVDSFGFIFLFQVIPTIIFFSALTSLLYYLNIIQVVVKGMAWFMSKTMKISGTESLSVAANIFLGQTESPLMIKAYLEKISKSEMFLVMVGGMATVAGGVLAAYIGFLGGEDTEMRLHFARHLLAASVMAAPGAIVVSKILQPQVDPIFDKLEISQDSVGKNVLEAITNGTTEGLKLAANVAAMLLVFIAMIAMLNEILGFAGEITRLNQLVAAHTPYLRFDLNFILGYLFAPLMWLIGVATEDISLMGQLLGIKLVASEFIGYTELAAMKNPENPLHLSDPKSILMATYMLCGFANFASIGIQIGGIGSLAPGRKTLLSQMGLKAMIGGTIASLLSATWAGMLFSA
jgi:concentrative nucleoside transporter, CNT family